ncbi:MAG: sugar phosphate isomerase/epimerase [Desulfobacteraceae bacterium]|nr:sugar phosphate isomerase/epimerase [Desulfobacteraceae bacterium]
MSEPVASAKVAPGLERYPFRVATTSYVHPCGYAENVELLAGWVEEVEVVLFEGSKEALPSEAEMETMAAVAKSASMRFHVHLPLNLRLGHPDRSEREASLRTLLRVAEWVRPLRPGFFVLHLEWDGPTLPGERDVRQWQRRVADSLRIVAKAGIDLRNCCVETLMYPPRWMTPVREEFGLPLCVDVGHMLLTGGDPCGFFLRHFEQVRTVHLYGPEPDGRHASLDRLPETTMDSVMEILRGFHGVVSLEVFDFSDLKTSIALLERAWRRQKGERNLGK